MHVLFVKKQQPIKYFIYSTENRASPLKTSLSELFPLNLKYDATIEAIDELEYTELLVTEELTIEYLEANYPELLI